MRLANVALQIAGLKIARCALLALVAFLAMLQGQVLEQCLLGRVRNIAVIASISNTIVNTIDVLIEVERCLAQPVAMRALVTNPLVLTLDMLSQVSWERKALAALATSMSHLLVDGSNVRLQVTTFG